MPFCDTFRIFQIRFVDFFGGNTGDFRRLCLLASKACYNEQASQTALCHKFFLGE